MPPTPPNRTMRDLTMCQTPKLMTAALVTALLVSGCGRAASKALGAVSAAIATEVVAEAAVQALTAPAHEQQASVIRGVRLEHNVFVNGEKGMRIHVDFTVAGHLGMDCKALVYGYHKNGLRLEDQDGWYTTMDGHVATHADFRPGYATALYEDLQMFLPYSQLHLDPTLRNSAKLQVQLYSTASGAILSNTYEVSFDFGKVD